VGSIDILISVKDLRKTFGGLHAIDGLDIDVKRGDIHGLIGPNGAGKTTFFNVITGILPATEGNVYFESQEITMAKPEKIAEMGISRTFQAGKLVPGMTVMDNVMTGAYRVTKTDVLGTFFRAPFTVSRQEKRMRKKAFELLDLVGMADDSNRWAADMVWVERQLIQIARAIAAGPKLLLLDEPTGGMGAEESQRVAEMIRKVRDELGVTVIVVGHDMNLVLGISDRITCINFGKIICEGTPGEVRRDANVLEAYLGKE